MFGRRPSSGQSPRKPEETIARPQGGATSPARPAVAPKASDGGAADAGKSPAVVATAPRRAEAQRPQGQSARSAADKASAPKPSLGKATVGKPATAKAPAAKPADDATAKEPGSEHAAKSRAIKDRLQRASGATEPAAGPARSDAYYEVKGSVFAALMTAMDVNRISAMKRQDAEMEIKAIVDDIVAVKNFVISTSEQAILGDEICADILGYGPLEPLLARDDIADIMVNGAGDVFIETSGKVHKTGIRFRDNAHLLEVCQRMVSKVGRRVDEASPMCDARLLDGSRVNVIAPPLAIDGAALTIRKFKKDKLRMTDLVNFGSISPDGAEVLEIASQSRCNVIISGGTGSGKTTLLNCLSGFAGYDERIITCEDSAELQLQQPHVVRLETRPPNIEGKGEITMRQLVKNCLRMRPERIIVGEVRGPEAFDLLQAMNTGHDGSMGTLHANSPREAISRIESMITMGGYGLPSRTIREMIASAVHVIVQAQRLRDGSRRITHVTEIIGMEGDTIVTQDLLRYEIEGEGPDGKLIGKHQSTGVAQPKIWERARAANRHRDLTAALARMEADE